MAIRFQIKSHRVGPPTIYMFSGKIPVGTYMYSAHTNEGKVKPYAWRLNLPGNERAGMTATTEEAEHELRLAFSDWLSNVGLKDWSLS